MKNEGKILLTFLLLLSITAFSAFAYSYSFNDNSEKAKGTSEIEETSKTRDEVFLDMIKNEGNVIEKGGDL